MTTAKPVHSTNDRIRLDKWLWAARFFKTRQLAKTAIAGGKVHCDGARCKVSKQVSPGIQLVIQQGWDEKEIEIVALSDQRRGAAEAQQLYCETAASIAKRAERAKQRKLAPAPADTVRPNKKQRRQIHRFTRN